ncbi:tRNA (N6-threonylcarbamoyladenosine(37)-N6)-methyltransferase TrmO [Erwinia sp. HR93]|uniref:tRNA (N6-threonylcarbamoyladenosine(37)-N6)-methyltransferase TrmO n=1 Tax=Erwinia sp. HR93 TaxID=3094840 RepID=UPI002ADEC36A|nr:tRNA (N6-threonylcarbamoyladenosine(37)-N6)-methyltransferase TrmO [Erwinia sp. HR93]MEA1063693.1 tRNA (N6-threonylcarbamoyladenosine(37)-N6)-methyltransferase TrmO [Erwinia sp. HR93]
MTGYNVNQIGVIRSPYKEKFAVPRQPGLVNSADGELHLLAPWNHPDAVRELEGFSHLWVLFIFHHTMDKGWRPTVRPPRLGGNTRVGVFASRSTFRPNPIGMSLLELKAICFGKTGPVLKLGGVDLVDGTPVIDIKPYLPFAEAIPGARSGYAPEAPTANMPVRFTPEVMQQLAVLAPRYPTLKQFICEVLAQDPRPAYRKTDARDKTYAAWLMDFNVRWRIDTLGAEVFALELS